MTIPYSSAGRDDSEDGLLEDEKRGEIFIPRRTPKRTIFNRWWGWFLQALAFTCSLTLFILSQYREPSDAACTRKINTWSPAFDAVEYHETNFLGEFEQPSPYRGLPTPELDWQWEELIEGSAFNIPKEKLHLFNISKETMPKLYHTESGGLAASAWGFHQIHCVNVLRQISYKEEYYRQGRLPQILTQEASYSRKHVDHCIELLRQDLVCRTDVTPYFILNPLPGTPPEALKVDFSVHKKCRDINQVKKWVRSNIVIESFKDPFVKELEFTPAPINI
ncbi:hypothetical protein BKA66DRAFT_201242 [Pyrenochaeta sp. MPI-SDFR-AT-0127]|nr:hypothetical protein BKA66DRAFT_201242 [Pyrenochaeta sp. MPI-SDFR-AT-0127]